MKKRKEKEKETETETETETEKEKEKEKGKGNLRGSRRERRGANSAVSQKRSVRFFRPGFAKTSQNRAE